MKKIRAIVKRIFLIRKYAGAYKDAQILFDRILTKMAFIPDDAIDRFNEIAPASQLGYQQICRYRNHETGICPKTIDEIIEICTNKYNWSRATKFNVKKQLKDKEWIQIFPDGVKPLVGNFSPMSKQKEKSKKLDSENDQYNFLDSQLQGKEPQSKKLDFETEESLKNYTEQSKKLDPPPYNPHKDNLNYNQPLNQLLNSPPFSDFSDPSAFLKLDLSALTNFDTVARIFRENAAICEEARKPSNGKKKINPIDFKEFRIFYELYEFWKIVFKKNSNTRITAPRIRSVIDRLRTHNAFTLEELKTAVIGCRASPNHNGANFDTIYNDLELICRSDQQVEKMIGYFDAAVTLKNGVNDAIANGKPNAKYPAEGKYSGRSKTEPLSSNDIRKKLRAARPPA